MNDCLGRVNGNDVVAKIRLMTANIGLVVHCHLIILQYEMSDKL